MSLQDLGFTESISEYLEKNNYNEFTPARVMLEHRERYVVSTGESEYEAEITGNLRFTASSRSDFPAVGDWVAVKIYPNMAIIHHVLPRKSILERQSVSKAGEKQVIAANVDVAFIVQSIDNNFNINRLERYMTVCYSSGILPVMVISKTDLAVGKEIDEALRSVQASHAGLQIIALSNLTGEGLDMITELMKKGITYCFMGSSGVGKSTLINNITGKNNLRTREISSSTNKGKHTTAHRELIVLENGAIVIDTPGMREFGITDDNDGIAAAFHEIKELAMKCRFSDCTHGDEKGCAVREAVEKGIIQAASLENYKRLQREQEHFSSTVAEKRRKDKAFGKMAKEILKEKKKNKF
ncbi:MAG TPA: ribosome small subunit-dependent GTPase A [Bacteroidales bacterium]|jgi:ribosome biogenesis GTPase|nr:ribosome small subunit-dependent GTPase A [Bacteroidales bacterium]